MSLHKEMKQTVRQYRRLGFSVSRTRRGHLRFEHPSMEGRVIGSSTPSDRRANRNLKAKIRRYWKP